MNLKSKNFAQNFRGIIFSWFCILYLSCFAIYTNNFINKLIFYCNLEVLIRKGKKNKSYIVRVEPYLYHNDYKCVYFEGRRSNLESQII